MEAIILSKEQFQDIINRLEAISARVAGKNPDSQNSFMDNQEFLLLMKISKRTAQAWRDEGKISFSQVGNKIYYKISDVEGLLEKHYRKAFNKDFRINHK